MISVSLFFFCITWLTTWNRHRHIHLEDRFIWIIGVRAWRHHRDVGHFGHIHSLDLDRYHFPIYTDNIIRSQKLNSLLSLHIFTREDLLISKGV